MRFVLFFLAFSVYAKDCKIERPAVSCQSAEDCSDFTAYAKSQKACGVEDDALPYILPSGKKPAVGTIVLVHGLQGSPALMNDIAKRAQGEGYNVVVPILTAHGGDEQMLTHADLGEWKKDVAFASDVATKLGGPLYMIGHSTGGVMAAIEASAHPGRFKALAGLDPALNVVGPKGWKLAQTCKAKHFYDFPSEILAGWSWPEIPWISEKSCKTSSLRRDPKLVSIIDNLNVALLMDRFCKKDIPIGHHNPEETLAAVCALAQATAEVTADTMKKLPPSLIVLSRDESVFGYISKNEIREAVVNNPQHRIMQTQAPVHAVMASSCSPEYNEYMAKIDDWLASHR